MATRERKYIKQLLDRKCKLAYSKMEIKRNDENGNYRACIKCYPIYLTCESSNLEDTIFGMDDICKEFLEQENCSET